MQQSLIAQLVVLSILNILLEICIYRDHQRVKL